jgi:hypothetical protein
LVGNSAKPIMSARTQNLIERLFADRLTSMRELPEEKHE